MNTAEAIFLLVKIWGSIGGVVAVAFLLIGIDRIDEDADGAYVFRPLLVPGILIIWPLVLWRWFVLETGRDVWSRRYAAVRRVHGLTSLLFALAIILVIVVGMSQRQTWPADIAPERLEAPE